MLRPTVLNAETHSNNRYTGFFPFSDIRRQKKPAVIINIERKIIDNTLFIVLWPISLFPITKCCRPRMLFHAERKAIANVVVFIPPPVDPGDAPIHIRKIIINIVG